MKLVYSGRTELDAHQARLFLESHGIDAVVVGESAAFTNFSFTPTSEPGVSVDEADLQRATLLMRDYAPDDEQVARRGPWICPNCGEWGEDSFELCWKCEAPRPLEAVTADSSNYPEDVESEMMADDESNSTVSQGTDSPVTTADDSTAVLSFHRSKARLWCEVLLVLAIAQPYLFQAWLYSRLKTLSAVDAFAAEAGIGIGIEVFIAGCALAVIVLSGEPWSTFGLKRPRLLWDLFGAGLLCIFAVRAMTMSNGLFLDALIEWLPRETYHRLMDLPSDWIAPRGIAGLLLALLLSLAVGFSEELVYRGFLIARFELLFGSTTVSVILSSVLFAAMHFAEQGIFGVWNGLGFGVIFGIVFAYFRRLWPLVFAHAIVDFVVFIRSVDA